MSWTETDLCTDEDIRHQESRMPELAKSIKRPFLSDEGSKVDIYTGKRAIAKREIGQRLTRMGQDLDTIAADGTKVTSLLEVAVYKELELIFWDMADRNDTVSADKARRYARMYEDAWIDVVLALGIQGSDTGIGFIPAKRA